MPSETPKRKIPFVMRDPKDFAAGAEETLAPLLARVRAEDARILQELDIGKPLSGKGIFAGIWMPSEDGRALGKMFNLFAAPHDGFEPRGRIMTFNDAARCVAGLRNWHGYDGCALNCEISLNDAIRKGAYQGQWFIPTQDILRHMLYSNASVEGFAQSFKNEQTGDSEEECWYLSCTQTDGRSDENNQVDFRDGLSWGGQRLTSKASLRLVRAEPRYKPSAAGVTSGGGKMS